MVTAHKNPVINTFMYEFKFQDDLSGVYTANVIAENIWRSVNNDGHQEDSLRLILDHKFSKNVIKDGYVFD